MSEILTGPEDLTPEWLTQTLRESGELLTGAALAVEPGTTDLQPVSITTPVAVRYSPDAPAAAPTRLFLKTTRPPHVAAGAEREVGFYRRVAPRMPECPAPRCFHAAHSPERALPPPARRSLRNARKH